MNVASINLAPHVASMNLLSGLCLWLVAWGMIHDPVMQHL